MPPPLPPQLITTILSHLLPPQPPLPHSLLATPLLDRLKYLPPDEADLDAWLSPIPSPARSPSIISDRLQRLAVSHRVQPVQYAHDGESVVARLSLRDDTAEQPEGVTEDSGIDIMFSYEHADQSRGWVYHSSQIPALSEDEHHSWSSSPDIPFTPPDDSQGNADPSVEDYWKGFTPPTPTTDLPQADEDVEDAYWASYGGGQSGQATPARNRSMANLQKLKMEAAEADRRDDLEPSFDDGRREDDFANDQKQPERVMCDMPTTAQKVLDPLAALLATIPDSLSRDEPTPSSPSREANDLRDKVMGRIQASLRDVWAGYTRDAEARPESLEERALGWLRIARAVVDGTEVHGSTLDEIVVKAKMDVLREMYVVVAPAKKSGSGEAEGESDGFWRYIEAAIKMPMAPGSANDDGMTQETYWE